MTVLSYNVRNAKFPEENYSDVLNNWRFRREAVVDLIRKADPDILALQEDSDRQQRYIQHRLRETHRLYCNRDFYEADNAHNGIFVRKTVRVIDSGAFWISRNGKDKAKVEGSICFRHATYLHIEVLDAPVLVVNVHLDHSKDAKVKSEEALVLIDLLEKLSGNPPTHTFVIGDFNSTPNGLPHKLFEKYGLWDSANLQNNAEPTNPHWLQHPKCERIDYVWISEDLRDKLRTYKVLGDTYRRRDGTLMEPSDHYPVFAEFDT
jgi:endonuclease/exonuclease/phosphatase family metal-dependent hydrolase